jgi:hypothetical protein
MQVKQQMQKNELYPVTVNYEESKVFPSNSFFKNFPSVTIFKNFPSVTIFENFPV